MLKPILTEAQASRLRKLVRLYRPQMGKSWKRRNADELWLRVLSQIVFAGNAAPGDALRTSPAVRERLAYSRLKKLSPRRRRQIIHSVLRAIGTRYVGTKSPNRKVDAALHNFKALDKAGGPQQFFKKIDGEDSKEAMIEFLSKEFDYYKKRDVGTL